MSPPDLSRTPHADRRERWGRRVRLGAAGAGAIAALCPGIAPAAEPIGGALCVVALQGAGRMADSSAARWKLLMNAQLNRGMLGLMGPEEDLRRAERYLAGASPSGQGAANRRRSQLAAQCLSTAPLATLPNIPMREGFPQTGIDHLHACMGALTEWSAVIGRSYDAEALRRMRALDAVFVDAKIVTSMPEAHWAAEALRRIQVTGLSESVDYCARYYTLLLRPPSLPES